MKKFSIEIRRIPDHEEIDQEVHERFLAGISTLPGTWSLVDLKLLPKSKGNLVNGLSITRALKMKHAKGMICYSLRKEGYLEIHGKFDDFIGIEVDMDKVDYQELTLVFKTYVASFSAYCAFLRCMAFNREDHDRLYGAYKESGVEPNSRCEVFRFHVLNFFDVEYCERVFNKNLDEVILALSDDVVATEQQANGILISLPEFTDDIEALRALDIRLREKLVP